MEGVRLQLPALADRYLDAARGLLHLTDLESLDDFGGDPRLFFDGVHMMEGNATRLLRRIYGVGGPSCAVQ